MDRVELSVRIPEMQFLVSQAIQKYRGDVGAEVDTAVAQALKDFNWEQHVSREIDTQLREAVKRTISQALAALLYDSKFNRRVEKALAESLANAWP